MPMIAEKSDFTDARAVRVCAVVTAVTAQSHEKPHFNAVGWKMAVQKNTLDPAIGLLVNLSMF